MPYLLFLFILTTLSFADEKFKIGEAIYKDTCISCHGEDGKAEIDLKLVVKPRSLKSSILTQKQSYLIIKEGAHYWGASADIMPAFKSVYDEQELQAVAYYIKKAFNPDVKKRIETLYAQSDTIPPQKRSKMMKKGLKIFKRNCSWCHGLDAKGDGAATHNPEKSIYPYDLGKTLLTEKQMFLYAKYGGKFWGTDKNDMPSWKRKYNDFTLKSVAYYINQTFKKKTK